MEEDMPDPKYQHHSARALRGAVDKKSDPRPKRIDREKAIREAAYYRFLERTRSGVAGTAETDYMAAAREYDRG